jgi:hypothetical protein
VGSADDLAELLGDGLATRPIQCGSAGWRRNVEVEVVASYT